MIIHLTHTDLRFDNRIRKEISSLKKITNSIIAFGVFRKDDEVAAWHNDDVNDNCYNLKIWSYNFTKKLKVITFFIFWLELSLKILLKAVKIKPKIIHCHDTLVLPVGYILKFFFNATLIYDAHELESNKFGQTKILSYLTLKIEKFCWKKIDVLISVSDSIIKWYTDNLGHKKSVRILNSPSFKISNSNENRYLYKKFNISYQSDLFVYIGAFEKGRSIRLLIEIFGELDNNKSIVFLGFGKLENEIKLAAKENSNIFFHKPVSTHKVGSIINGCSAGFCLIEDVSMSDYLSLPNKLFEYLLAEVPVIGSDFPEISNVLNNSDLGLVSDLDKKSIKDCVTNFKKFKNFNFRKNCNKLVWEYQEKLLINLYKTI